MTVGSRSRNTARGACLPAPVSLKNVLKASSPPPTVLSLGIGCMFDFTRYYLLMIESQETIGVSSNSQGIYQQKLLQALICRGSLSKLLSCDSSGGVSSSFNIITPTSAVFQVVVGGGGGGGFIGGGAAATGGASSGGAVAAAAEAPPAEEKKEEKEESDDDMGFSLFD